MTTTIPNLTRIPDLDAPQLELILDEAERYRHLHRLGARREEILGGQVVALVFEKPSLRTKVTFEVAAASLGGTPVFLSSEQILASGSNQPGRESIPDIARNLERFCDMIVARVYSHETIRQLSDSVKIPVVNALCDQHHPCQALADFMTIRTLLGAKKGRPAVAFVGDGNNVATSLMHVCALGGFDFRIACPSGFEIPAPAWAVGEKLAAQSGVTLRSFQDPAHAVREADVVYTDTFVSMGQEKETAKRAEVFRGFQVDAALMSKANSGAIFMHCLPAHRGEEVTDQVMDSKQSVVFDQAECRLHVAKALLKLYLTGRGRQQG